jgi:hypothetical protein
MCSVGGVEAVAQQVDADAVEHRRHLDAADHLDADPLARR